MTRMEEQNAPMEAIDKRDAMMDRLLGFILKIPPRPETTYDKSSSPTVERNLQGWATKNGDHYQAYLGPHATSKKNSHTWVTILTHCKDLWK